MWHDTSRFIRCVKQTFDLRGPIHEYGTANTAAAFSIGNPLLDGKDHTAAPDCPRESESFGSLAHLPFASGSAGTVACLNVLQHAAEPGAVAAEMIRLLAPSGLLLLCSCTGGRARGADLLWRPGPHAFQTLLAPLEATLIGWQGSEGDPHSIYAIGTKAPVAPGFLAGANHFLRDFQESLDRDRLAVPWRERFSQWLLRWTGKPSTGRACRDYYQWRYILHAPVDADFRHTMLEACPQPRNTGSRLDRPA